MNALPVNEDKTLVLQLRDNSAYAFDFLFSKYSEKLFRFAFSLLKKWEYELEIIQKVFYRIWDKMHVLYPSKKFTISCNFVIDQLHLNIKNQDFRNCLSFFIHKKEGSNSISDHKISGGSVEIGFKEFPQKRIQCYLISREDGLLQKECTKISGISVKTAENQINFSLKHLK